MNHQIREIEVKSIISQSSLDVDFVINPYVGCLHGCLYCYARFMKRFTDHPEPWGQFLDIKINAPELISEKSKKYKNCSIMLSSVTDPYQPMERKYELTHKILKKLIPLEPKLCILTKSDLVLRDIDLLKQFKDCEVGISLSVLDDKIRKEIEPQANSVQRRLNALKLLKKSGLKTFIFISPIFPELTDWQKIIRQVREDVDFFMFENLNIRPSNWLSVKNWLKKFHPDLLKKYFEIYFSLNKYWNVIEKEIFLYGQKNNLDFRIYFHH